MAVAREGSTGKAMAALRQFGEFRTSGYPRVVVGMLESAGDFLETLRREDSGGGSSLTAFLGRVLPVEDTLPFERDDVTETLCDAFEEMGPRLAGRSFFVRARLRGLKGRLEHPAVERALGTFLYERAEACGDPATVAFKDPDIVVAVEVVGGRVGYAFLDRDSRALSLVRIR